MHRHALLAGIVVIALLAAGRAWQMTAAPAAHRVQSDTEMRREVLRGYRRLAHLSYQNAYHSAGRLRHSIQTLLQTPSAQSLQAARQAWRSARRDYAQTEVFRFGNWIVDEWELGINAWPVDEGLLDYVDTHYSASPTNPLARHNLVSNPHIEIAGITLDSTAPSWAQLKFIHGGSAVEANVALGYHAIEFMLWGQDLSLDTPGQRPWSDYADNPEQCTSGHQPAPLLHCRRRASLLAIMAEHLYSELGSMTLKWAGNNPGSYGLHLVNGDIDEGLRRMLFGLIRLAGDELSGERMQVALFSHSAEEEQDCFSDDTHQSLYFNGRGLANIYYGRYTPADEAIDAPYQAPVSLARLVRQHAPQRAQVVDQRFAEVEASLAAIRHAGEHGHSFEQLIQPDHPTGGTLLRAAITALQSLASELESLARLLGLERLNPQAPAR